MRIMLAAVCGVSVAVAGVATATNGVVEIPLAQDLAGHGYDNTIGQATLSDDGSVVAGFDAYNTSFVWTATGGLQVVPIAAAKGVSGNGDFIFGTGSSTNAQRWSRSSPSAAPEELGAFTAPFPGSFAQAASTNGSVVVGSSFTTAGTGAFRWTASGGMQNLGFLEDFQYRYAEANGVSGDGSVVVGSSAIDAHDPAQGSWMRAYRWTEAGGMQNLGTFAGAQYSASNAVSKDGTAIVGYSGSDYLDHAFRWTAAGGMQDLGTLVAGFSSQARGVSGDGSIVVGTASTAGDPFGYASLAFIWTETGGMQTLGDYLTGIGIDLGGVTFYDAATISADGTTILASGYTVAHDVDSGLDYTVNRSYLVTVPAPGAFALLGAAGLASRRRRR